MARSTDMYEIPDDALTCLACQGHGIIDTDDGEVEDCEACGGHGWVN